MIYNQTKLNIVDNSGAVLINVFHLVNYKTSQKYSCVGDLVMGSVLNYKANKKITKKQLCRVLVITSKSNILSNSGSFINFDENRGVILADMSNLLSTRVFGPISSEVNSGVFSSLLSIAKNVV